MKKSKEPQDIKKGWHNPIRAAQAACHDNKGYAIVTLRVVVNKNEPVFWLEPNVQKIHPAAIAGVSFSPVLIGLLAEITTDVDNRESGKVE